MSRRVPTDCEEYAALRLALAEDVAALLALQVPEGAVPQAMDDGGMGSFFFSGQSDSDLARPAAHFTYSDEDGVIVSIAVMVAAPRTISCIDFWKIDFAPIKRFPEVEDLTRQD